MSHSLSFSLILPPAVHLIQPLVLLQSVWEDMCTVRNGENLKIAEVPEEERLGREGRWIGGWGGGWGGLVERRKCFRVSVDKWVCGVGWGSGEHRQLGQRTPRETGKSGFLPAETPDRERKRGSETKRGM